MGARAGDGVLAAGIGEMVVSSDPGDCLTAYGLGSCVALTAWDPVARVGALAHFMLPAGPAGAGSPVKFIDPGIDAFLGAVKAAGASAARCVFKAAGAASMLAVGGGLAIGKRNQEALAEALSSRGIALAAASFGGNAGRTVQLGVADGRLTVRSLSATTEL